MDMSNLLNQLLGSSGNPLSADTGSGKQNNPAGGVQDFLSGRGGAALAGGALGLLLGSKKGRKVGGKALKYGGVAALGLMAYKAYGNWQANSGQDHGQAATPQTMDRVSGPAAEQHSTAVLKAIIAAAKSDGHVDERERQLIDEGMRSLTNDSQLLQWVDNELQKPLDPVEVASAASTTEIASEMYLASALVIDEASFMERSYLQELAVQLKLEPGLLEELNAQAEAAQASAGPSH